MVMAGKSDAASMSAASNRPSTAQRRRFSRSIASRASEASSPASPASSASLSGKSIVSVAIARVSPARCSNTGLDHLRPGGSQTMFDSPARSEIPTRIACRTKLAHTPVPVSEDERRQDVHRAPAYNFGANVRARAGFAAGAANGSLSRTVYPAARMAPTMSFAIRELAEDALRPWIVRHNKGTHWVGTEIERRRRIDGAAVADAVGSTGLPVPAAQLLPFFLAARSAVNPGKDLLGDTLCSSYEAFRNTRQLRTPDHGQSRPSRRAGSHRVQTPGFARRGGVRSGRAVVHLRRTRRPRRDGMGRASPPGSDAPFEHRRCTLHRRQSAGSY